MKRLNFFATMSLAMVLGLGVAIEIGSAKNEAKCAEAVASDPNQYVRIYFSGLESWGDVNLNPSFKVGPSGTVYTSVLSASGTPTLDAIFNSANGKYVCDLPISSTQTNNIYNYFQSGNKTWWHPNDGDNYWSDNTKIYHSFKQAYIVQIAFTNTDHNNGDAWTQAWYNYTPSDLGYFVHYDYNGGTAATGAKSNQEATGSWTTQAAPSKSGYTFAGWKRSDTSAIVGAGVSQVKPASPITLTAQWTAQTSTVTLNRQGATTGSTSVTATYGSAMPSITLPTKTGYTFGGYWTEAGGTGTKYYNADGTSARNWDKTGAQTLYAQWTGYFVSINDGSYESMTLNTQNPNEYYIEVTVNAGDTLTFKKNDSAYAVTPKSDATNNNYNEAGFLFGGTFNIYLDVVNNTIWSAGISTTVGYYLMVDGNIIGSALATNPDNPNEVYLTQHEFTEGQNINIFHIAQGDQIYYEYKNPDLNSASAADCFEDTGVDLTCLKTDFYDMYYNFSTNSAYFGISAATYCNSYAVAFNTAISTICTGIVGGTKSIADLKTAWKTQYDNWVQMGEDNIYAQGIMTNYDKTLPDNIGLCVTKYEYIVGKYGDALAGTGYTVNFMNRSITPSARMSLFKNIIDLNTTGTVAIVVISSLVTIGAFAGYFFYRKKKED